MDERTKFQNALRGANGANDNRGANTGGDQTEALTIINISDTVIMVPTIKKNRNCRAIVLALRELLEAGDCLSKKTPSFPPVQRTETRKKSEKNRKKFTSAQVNTNSKKTGSTCDKNTYHKLSNTEFGFPPSFVASSIRR
ncbi:hypothetical protein [Thalassospira alkalitolerans]|uniref:hypothetical protein n=1 Tax=Thalassospira alkalitolerans TaxID=1293890 RepID=UPI0030EEC7DA|tara:strand:+ start:9226 stop:9645 length:420 start_codon:yes stop_codon:yes gene_type:complete